MQQGEITRVCSPEAFLLITPPPISSSLLGCNCLAEKASSVLLFGGKLGDSCAFMPTEVGKERGIKGRMGNDDTFYELVLRCSTYKPYLSLKVIPSVGFQCERWRDDPHNVASQPHFGVLCKFCSFFYLSILYFEVFT